MSEPRKLAFETLQIHAGAKPDPATGASRRELLATSCFIEKVGAPEQRVVHDVASLRGEKVNYLSLLLVQNPKRARGELRRGCRKRAQQPTTEALS